MLAAATPLGVALVVAGTVAVLAADRGFALVVPGALLLAGGVAGTQAVLGGRTGDIAFLGFVLTQISFLLAFVLGLGFATLVVASPLLAWGLVRMRRPLPVSAVALLAVWPVAALVAAATRVGFVEAFAALFPLPYAVLAAEALRLRE